MTYIKKRGSICGAPVVEALTFHEAIEHARSAGYSTIETLAGPIPLPKWLPYAEPDWRIFTFCESLNLIVDECASPGLYSSHWPLRR